MKERINISNNYQFLSVITNSKFTVSTDMCNVHEIGLYSEFKTNVACNITFDPWGNFVYLNLRLHT